MSVIEHKCPNCGGYLRFDEAIQKMKCDFCDSAFDIAELSALAAQHAALNQDGAAPSFDSEKVDVLIAGESGAAAAAAPAGTASAPAWDVVSGGHEVPAEQLDQNAQGTLRAWSCPSCGGQIIGDQNTVATRCPYCDNNAIIASQLEGSFKPDFVIPFKKGKEEAQAAYLENCQGHLLLPRDYVSQQRLEEITGMYVPFWLYSCTAHGTFTIDAEKHEDLGSQTKIDHYECQRSGTVAFTNVPADGSQSMDDVYMEAIEPFNCSEMVPFDTAYLSGHLADRYDDDSEAKRGRVAARIKQGTEDLFLAPLQHNYDSVSVRQRAVDSSDLTVSQALMPVWMLNARYNGKLYDFAMNAQTGQLVGKLPISRGRQIGFSLLFGLIAIAVCCLLGAVFIDSDLETMVICAIAGIGIDGVIIWQMTRSMNTARANDSASAYADELGVFYDLQDDRYVRTSFESNGDDD